MDGGGGREGGAVTVLLTVRVVCLVVGGDLLGLMRVVRGVEGGVWSGGCHRQERRGVV